MLIYIYLCSLYGFSHLIYSLKENQIPFKSINYIDLINCKYPRNSQAQVLTIAITLIVALTVNLVIAHHYRCLSLSPHHHPSLSSPKPESLLLPIVVVTQAQVLITGMGGNGDNTLSLIAGAAGTVRGGSRSNVMAEERLPEHI
jgi:hypothetical protein